MSADALAARLPDLPTLRRWWQSLAALDAVMSPDWEGRYFSFDAAWSEHEQTASMRNGSGDDASVTFTPAGAYLRGFDHESPLSPWTRTPPSPYPGLLDVPAVLRDAALEPAWQLDDVPAVTVSLWRLADDDRWHVARASGQDDEDDGSDGLFEVVDGDPRTWLAFAEEYYEPEQALDREVVEHVFAHRPLTPDLARRLQPDVSFDQLRADLAEIGFPAA